MAGWKGAKEVLPAILVSGVSFAAMQWFSSNFLSPMLPDILSALFSMLSLVFFLRVWRPKSVWRFPGEAAEPARERVASGADPAFTFARDQNAQPGLEKGIHRKYSTGSIWQPREWSRTIRRRVK